MATTFDINQFRTKLKNGGARPNQFEVQFTFPPAIAALNAAYARSSSFLVTGNISFLPPYAREEKTFGCSQNQIPQTLLYYIMASRTGHGS